MKKRKIVLYALILVSIAVAMDEYKKYQEELNHVPRIYNTYKEHQTNDGPKRSFKRFDNKEPNAEDVTNDQDVMYNWIIDNPDYNGDWEFWVDKYESEIGY